MHVLYYEHLREKCSPDSISNENSVPWREREKKNKQNKNNDMNNRILPVHVRAKTKRESFN